MVKKATKSNIKKSNTGIGSNLRFTRRFAQPLLYVVIGLCIVAGAIMIYASFAAATPVVSSNIEFWRPRIAQCESGGRYNASNGTGNYGAYQFDARTWKGAVGSALAAQYPLPSDAPPEIQDLAFDATFARRGSQPWNASFRCWATPELKGNISSLSVRLPLLGGSATPPPIPAPPKNAYNIKVSGRVYIDNVLTPNIAVVTCVDGVTTKTDAAGVFHFELPAGKNYCVRVVDGLPANITSVTLNNNSEHLADKTYEQQIAAKNYYHNIWQLFTPYYTWDRSEDSGFNFYFSTK